MTGMMPEESNILIAEMLYVETPNWASLRGAILFLMLFVVMIFVETRHALSLRFRGNVI